RHTRSYGDWSSDVCSSDLFQRFESLLLEGAARAVVLMAARAAIFVSRARVGQLVGRGRGRRSLRGGSRGRVGALVNRRRGRRVRSEERRVGKEWRAGGARG